MLGKGKRPKNGTKWVVPPFHEILDPTPEKMLKYKGQEPLEPNHPSANSERATAGKRKEVYHERAEAADAETGE